MTSAGVLDHIRRMPTVSLCCRIPQDWHCDSTSGRSINGPKVRHLLARLYGLLEPDVKRSGFGKTFSDATTSPVPPPGKFTADQCHGGKLFSNQLLASSRRPVWTIVHDYVNRRRMSHGTIFTLSRRYQPLAVSDRNGVTDDEFLFVPSVCDLFEYSVIAYDTEDLQRSDSGMAADSGE